MMVSSSTRRVRFVLVSAVLVSSLGLAGLASAEPSAADKETARGLMSEGRASRERGDLKAALKAFSAADALMHVPTTGLEVAKTQVALGLLVEARDTALRISRLPEKASEPAPFKQAREVASTLNDELEGRIPSLTVTVKNVPEGATASVTIDEASVPTEALGSPRKLNPGHHVIVAKAGSVDAKQEVDLAEKDRKELAVELPAPAAPAASSTSGDSNARTEQPTESTGKSGFSKALMFGGFGIAGAGVLAGAITGVLSMSKTNSIKSSSGCAGGVCGPTEYDDISSARSLATISTASFVAAGAGAVLGVVGLLTGNSSATPSSTTPEKAPDEANASRIEPWLGFGAAGVRGSF
jgi:hypothetical protein